MAAVIVAAPPTDDKDDDAEELRSIRVVVRVRPAADEGGDEAVIPKTSSELEVDCGPDKKFSCAFDAVLPPTATQDDVYAEIADVVASAADGFNACVLAHAAPSGDRRSVLRDGRAAPDAAKRQQKSAVASAEKRGRRYPAGRAELEETKSVWADSCSVGLRASPSFQRWGREHERTPSRARFL